ncbi:response regulator [Haliangium sp.]|uniref:response regulator n=1 Tax=Haliangium sp. TaxID=2663208 RepID=UPI003D09945B
MPPPPSVHVPPADRILVVDDNAAIHEDFQKILGSVGEHDPLDDMSRQLFGAAGMPPYERGFVLDSVYQGREALARVEASLAQSEPYAMVFLDVRMPPGWDGLETLEALWSVDERLQVVLCTAYADYSWEEITARVGDSDQLLILKKPFHSTEVRQIAQSLSTKWRLARELDLRFADLEERVTARTLELERANLELRREMEERARAERALRRAQRNEALGRLAAGLAHEVNNPLTFLMASLDSIQGELDGSGDALPVQAQRVVTELLETTLVGAERIAQIVRDIKLLARPLQGPGRAGVSLRSDDTGGTRLSTESGDEGEDALDTPLETDLRPVVERAGETATRDLRGRVSVDVAIDDPMRLGIHGSELEQVFLTLIENTATTVSESRDDGRVRVTVRRDPDNGDALVDIVGSGVPRDPAGTTLATVRPLGRRRRLGLAVARSILLGNDGEVEERTPTGGSIGFTVRLAAARIL